MDAKTTEILEKVATYVEMTQPLLDQHNENRNDFVKRAHQVIGVLANKGLVQHTDVNTIVDKLASDETRGTLFDLVEKLANAIEVDSLGDVSPEKLAGVKLDPWEKLALYGDPRADVSTTGTLV